MITALCGGVGGSKLVLGLYGVLPHGDLAVVVNTADDLEVHGLFVCPDLDTVTYTLSGLARRDVGWGIEGDTFNLLDMLRGYGVDTWFQLGDRDLATIVFRTELLGRGERLTAITRRITSQLEITASILPMTDARVATKLMVNGDWIDFQEYFVHRRHAEPVEEIRYDGMEDAVVTDEVRDALESAEAIILVNSNPVLSLLPILAVSGINELVASSSVARVAVSPIIGQQAVTGPAGDLMQLVGQPSTATGVANAYLGLIDGIVIDQSDMNQTAEIEALGLRVLVTDTIMRTVGDRERLAAETLDFARGLQ